MRKINEMLEKIDALISVTNTINVNGKFAIDDLRRSNEKLADIICELKAKNAVLERDNEVLVNVLMLKGDTEVVIYRGKRYGVMDRTVKDTPGDIETLDLNCIIKEEDV